jgi:hypothetical protein
MPQVEGPGDGLTTIAALVREPSAPRGSSDAAPR